MYLCLIQVQYEYLQLFKLERGKMNTETIENRKSVRTFNEEPVPAEMMAQVRDFLQHDENPFGVAIEYFILDAKKDRVSSPVIVGADTYVAGKCRRQKNAEIAFGYSFEKFILFATSLGLGTVWLAGTIDRKAFERAIDLKEDEMMPAVSPLGFAAKKRSLRDSMMRKGLKSDSRMPFAELFFRDSFQQPLEEKDAGIWKTALDMVRLAPSATNKQPWRVIVTKDGIHLYEKKTKGYANQSGDIQKVDLGIAMYHFEISADQSGLKGRWIQEDPGIQAAQDTEYIATFVREKN